MSTVNHSREEEKQCNIASTASDMHKTCEIQNG